MKTHTLCLAPSAALGNTMLGDQETTHKQAETHPRTAPSWMAPPCPSYMLYRARCQHRPHRFPGVEDWLPDLQCIRHCLPSHSSQLDGTTVPQPSTLRKLPALEAMLRRWCSDRGLQDSTANSACPPQISPCVRCAMAAACSSARQGVPACWVDASCAAWKAAQHASTACQDDP